MGRLIDVDALRKDFKIAERCDNCPQYNKRTNHMITYNGETLCAADWCNRIGMAESTLWRRLTSGWSVEDALTQPIQRYRR